MAEAIRHFSSLEACVSHIKSHFPPTETVQLETAKDIDSEEEISAEVPAYLYRGESHAYPSTTSTMHRLRSDNTLSYDVRRTIENTSRRLNHDLQEFMSLTPALSTGFLQHYGAPTEFLDVTASIEAAAFFACGDVDSKGFMCVFPVAAIADRSIILDLSQHPDAERPRRQAAYAFFHQVHVDLKSDDAIGDLQLKWFSFTLTDDDKAKYAADGQFLDAYTDQVAGTLQLLMDDFDKICDVAAKWLSDRIVAAPFVAKVVDEYSPGQPRIVALTPLCATSIEYDEEKERENNYRKWSTKFPEMRKHKLRTVT